jgi:hypothetical protein
MTSLTHRDNNQIERHEHDESVDAKRVYIVGGADIKVNADTSHIANSVASAVKEGLADIIPSMKLEQSSKIEIVEVEKYIVVKEPQIVEIEKQIVVKEKELVYVDKPVIIEKIVYKEIEKPILMQSDVKKEKTRSYHAILIGCMVLQTLMLIGMISLIL